MKQEDADEIQEGLDKFKSNYSNWGNRATLEELVASLEDKISQAYLNGWLDGKQYLTNKSAAILKQSIKDSSNIPEELK